MIGEAGDGKEAISDLLARAADDHKFLVRLADDPAKVLKEYELTPEQGAASSQRKGRLSEV